MITDAGRQSEDIDRMFDDVYTEMAELEREQDVTAKQGGGGAQGAPGRDGDDADAMWPVLVSQASTNLADSGNLARLNAVQTFSNTNTWSALNNNFDEIVGFDKGIAFAAAQVASTDANTLDDYEEGTWTPTVGGSGGQSGQIYATQAGFYVKIGKMVFAQAYVQLSTEGTITGFAEIQGFPFTSENTANQFTLGPVQWSDFDGTTWVNLNGRMGANVTVMLLMGATVAAVANTTRPTATDVSGGSFFVFSIVYRASA